MDKSERKRPGDPVTKVQAPARLGVALAELDATGAEGTQSATIPGVTALKWYAGLFGCASKWIGSRFHKRKQYRSELRGAVAAKAVSSQFRKREATYAAEEKWPVATYHVH